MYVPGPGTSLPLIVAKSVLFTPLAKFEEAYGSPPTAPSIVNKLKPLVFL